MNASCHTYKVSQKRISCGHRSHMNEACHAKCMNVWEWVNIFGLCCTKTPKGITEFTPLFSKKWCKCIVCFIALYGVPVPLTIRSSTCRCMLNIIRSTMPYIATHCMWCCYVLSSWQVPSEFVTANNHHPSYVDEEHAFLSLVIYVYIRRYM